MLAEAAAGGGAVVAKVDGHPAVTLRQGVHFFVGAAARAAARAAAAAGAPSKQ